MATHAVADRDEVLPGERGILVVGAHGADVGHRGRVQEQGL